MGFASGFQSGFGTVSSAMKAREERRLKEQLGQEAARYGVTEGAYGPELGENVQQVIGMRDQALQGLGEGATPEQRQQVLDQYTPALTELSRRTGLQGPDFSVGSREANFGTRQEAETAARPMRTAGLSRVYRESGDVDKADELELRGQQQELGGLQLGQAQRVAKQAKLVEKVDAQMIEWTNSRLQNEDGTTRAPTADDTIAGIQHRAGLLSQAGLGDQAAAALQQHLSIAANQIQVQTAQRSQALGVAASSIRTGDFGQVIDFYNQFVPDGATVTNVKEDPRTGQITVTRTALDGTKLPDSKIASRDELVSSLIAMQDPREVLRFSQQQFENNITEQELALKGDERSRKQREADAKPSVAAQRIYDVLKNTDSFKRAVERGDTAAQRQLLANSGIPTSELYKFGVEEPPGGGGSTDRGPFYEPGGRPPPAAPAAQTPGLSREPSPARQEQMRRMPITRFTGIGTLEQAARFGNEAAIRELERRDASAMQLGTQPPLLGDMGLQ